MSLSFNELEKIINDNEYINQKRVKKSKKFDSLSYLINKELTQSQCIRLGIAYEKILKEIILKFTELEEIKEKNKKNIKQKDHLFIDKKNKIIYYAELKGNLNLDTEKSKITCKKCLNIINELKEKYKNYEIKWCLLGFRYINIEECMIIYKYKEINNNVFGINEYLEMLNINLKFTYRKNENNKVNYQLFLNNIADLIILNN